MTIVLMTIAIIAIAMLIMGVGVILKGKCLRGSCGGLKVTGPNGELLCGACGRHEESEPDRGVPFDVRK